MPNHREKERIVRRHTLFARIGLVVLASLPAMPAAQTAPPVEAKKRPRTVTRAFANDVPIHVLDGPSLPSSVSASVYPSSIAVSGLKGAIRGVNLTLRNFGHDLPSDAQVLVGPGGQTAIVMAGSGGANAVATATPRLDDEAAAPIPVVGPLVSGAYQPRNIPGGDIAFTAPAPATSGNAALAVFDGANPNGEWRLFVQDAYGPTGDGYVPAGWELDITTKVKAKKKER